MYWIANVIEDDSLQIKLLAISSKLSLTVIVVDYISNYHHEVARKLHQQFKYLVPEWNVLNNDSSSEFDFAVKNYQFLQPGSKN